MRSITIYTPMLAFLAIMACGACDKSAPATSSSLQAESKPPEPATPATSSTTPAKSGTRTVQHGKRAALGVSGGEGKDKDTEKDSTERDERKTEERPVPTAAPPPTAGLSAGPALKLDKTTAHIGDTISVQRGEPFPSGATVHFGDIEAKPVKRLDGGRKLSFKVPKNASSGPVTVKIDSEAYTSESLTIE